jgi:hypothetical protein
VIKDLTRKAYDTRHKVRGSGGARPGSVCELLIWGGGGAQFCLQTYRYVQVEISIEGPLLKTKK